MHRLKLTFKIVSGLSTTNRSSGELSSALCPCFMLPVRFQSGSTSGVIKLSGADRMYRRVPPCTAAYRCVPPCTAVFRRVPPRTAVYLRVPPCTAAYRRLPPRTAVYRCVPPCTAVRLTKLPTVNKLPREPCTAQSYLQFLYLFTYTCI
jgi:hypothetical protein